jgi:hypothetical protein
MTKINSRKNGKKLSKNCQKLSKFVKKLLLLGNFGNFANGPGNVKLLSKR